MQFTIEHEITGKTGRLRVRSVYGFSARTAQHLSNKLNEVAGLKNVRVNARTGSVLLYYSSSQAREGAVQVFGIVSRTSSSLPACRPMPPKVPECTSGSGFGGLVRYLLLRPLLPMMARIITAVQAGLPYMLRGVYALRQGKLNVDVLDASAIGISLLRRDFRTVSLLTVLLGLGEALESWTRKKSRDSLAQSLALDVDAVWVRRHGEEVRVSIETLNEDDVVVSRAGSAIAVDGVVVEGEAVVNQASMTGEPLGVVRSAGAFVYAGTVVEEGEICIRPTGTGDGTRLKKIINFIEESQSLKAGVESRAMRLADMAVPFTFLLAGAVWLVTGNVARAASVLLVDYSCALRLATPLAVLAAMREGAANHVLIKGGAFLEGLAEADTVVFDKTGTLTAARPRVARVEGVAGVSPHEVLRLAACLEEHFPHPVARAVVRQAEKEQLSHREEHSAVEYVVAHGIASRLHGKRVLLGSRHYIEQDEGVDMHVMDNMVAEISAQGLSLLYLAVDGKLHGLIAIEDCIRPEAASVIAGLRQLGIKRMVMLTGDDQRTAAPLAHKLGLQEYRASVLPVDKAEIIRQLQAEGHKVIMIGDGINDAPALSAANVGISLRDGADLACEVADVVLTDSHLYSLLSARILGMNALRRIQSNFRWNMGLNSIFLGAGLAGLATPGTAAILHNVTTVGVTLNAMRPMLRSLPPSCEKHHA